MKEFKFPNTYTLSKALAEDIIHSYKQKLPLVILRPSFVWNAVNEPFKGFIEGVHSGMGLVCGGMTGFIRTLCAGKDAVSRFTPVDYVINSTLASAWRRSQAPKHELLVYNCTDAEENPLYFKKSVEMSKKYFLKYAPSEKLLWYPNISFTSNFVWYKISVLLFHLIPAFLIDTVRVLSGNKPM